MKFVKILKKILIGIVGIIFFSVALVLTILLLNYNDYGVTQLGGTSIIIIKEEISSKNYDKGDLVIVEETPLEKIDVGDEVFTYAMDNLGGADVQVGIVGKIYEKENAIAFENGDTYSMNFVIGKSTKTYDKIGFYLSIAESQWGFLFIVLVPCFLIFIYEIYILIIEIKYGKEMED